MLKRIAILTSGGDAPGMNAAIRAVTRCALNHGLEVYGIHDGYRGMYEGSIERIYRRTVSETLNRGGTFLGTARLPEFADIKVREEAVEQLRRFGIDAVVAIGGDGSYRGALALSKMGIKTVGIPGTIDNDIAGTDFTIGYDTTLNTIMEAVDKLRDTSSSHKRCSIVEVMGRNCGALAINAGISIGAEAVICKEVPYNKDEIVELIANASKFKRHAIIVVAEHILDVHELAREISAKTAFEARATILGHVQRGGSPTCRDRVLASRMGVKAVEALMAGESGVCVCIKANTVCTQAIEEALSDNTSKVVENLKVFYDLQ